MNSRNFFVDEESLWLRPESGWPEEVPRNLDLDSRHLYEVLADSCKRYGDRRVIWFQPLEATMTYKELKHAVDRFANGLYQQGVRQGDVVALMLPNSPQYIVGYYACHKLGAVVSGMNPTYKPGEVLHQLNITRAKVLVVLDALYEPQVAPVLDKSPVEVLVCTNIADMIKGNGLKKRLGKLLGKIPKGKVPSTALAFSDLLKSRGDPPDVVIDAHDNAVYLMTGGTTGIPKAAVLSHFNCVNNAKQAKAWIYKVEPGTAYVGILPLFHAFAMSTVMNTMLLSGGWVMLFPRPPKTDVVVEKIIELGPKEGTIYCGAEILFKRMGDFLSDSSNWERYADQLKGKLSLCISGASALHKPVQEVFENTTGARLSEGYGLTESSPVVSCAPFWGKRSIGTIGLPLPSTEWRIVDKADHTRHLGTGDGTDDAHIGELAVAGPAVMKGYLDNPEETANTLVEMDGKTWLLTGDIGYMDKLGRVILLDRKKQMIKYKGCAVFPKEVEELIATHEAVSEVAVAGLPDELTGEIIKAWVVLKDEAKGTISEEEMLMWCNENMARFKTPKILEFIDEIPKNLIGKVLRRVLQESDPLWIKANLKE